MTSMPAITPGSSAGSLTAWLRRRERVARCSAAISAHLHISPEQAEVLLLSEAHRRGLPVGLLAQRTCSHSSRARSWRMALCPQCGALARLQVSDDYQLERSLVCPAGHGVIG